MTTSRRFPNPFSDNPYERWEAIQQSNAINPQPELRRQPESKPVAQTKPIQNNWDSLSLFEQTRVFRSMQTHLKPSGRCSRDSVLRLCQAGFTPDSGDIEMYAKGLVDIDTLTAARDKQVAPKPPSLAGTLTEATRQLIEQNRQDESKRYLAIQEYNNSQVVQEPPKPNYM
jgi:hypothetical protein